MGFNQWMLAFHVLSAFSLVAGSTLFWVLVVAVRRIDTPDDTLRLGPVARVGNATIAVGMGGTIILGIYLAFAVDGYAIWDGWIIAALVLWAVGATLGRQVEEAFRQGPRKGARAQAGGRERSERRAPRAQPHIARRPLPRPDLGRPAPDHHRHDLEARSMSVLATVRPDRLELPALRARPRRDDPRRRPRHGHRGALLREGGREAPAARLLVADARLVPRLDPDAPRRAVDLLAGGLGRRSEQAGPELAGHRIPARRRRRATYS